MPQRSRHRDFSGDERDKLADDGKAMPDGSFPIVNEGDLKNAVRAFGRAKNKAAVKRHIIKRARALGKTDALPEDWHGRTAAVGPARLIALHGKTNAAPEWIQVIPHGTFSGRDGRGPYKLADAQAVIAATLAQNMEGGIAVDYDHAIDFAAPEGRPAPAAGWMREFEIRKGAIWAHVEWTPDGAKQVAAKHYKYFSPVFEHEKDGTVTRLLHGALTNNPNLEMQAVAAARRATMADETGDEEVGLGQIETALKRAFPGFSRRQIIQMIEHACDVEENADDPERSEDPEGVDDALTGIDAARTPYDAHERDDNEEDEPMTRDTDEMVKECARSLHSGDGEPTDEEMAQARKVLDARHAKHEEARRAQAARTEEAARQGGDEDDEDEGDDAEEGRHSRGSLRSEPPHTALRNLLRHARGDKRSQHDKQPTRADKQVMALTTEVNNLRHERAVEKATAAVDGAIKERRLTPAQRDWGIEYASRDLKGFQTFIAKQPVVMAPTQAERTTTAQVATPGGQIMDQVIANLGLDRARVVAHFASTKDDPRSSAAWMTRHSA